MKKTGFLMGIFLVFIGCSPVQPDQTSDLPNITPRQIAEVNQEMVAKFGDPNQAMIEKGVNHAASLWRTSDGDFKTFKSFCLDNFLGTSDEKTMVFNKLEKYFETLLGNFAEISVGLNENEVLDNGPLHHIDEMFSAYSPGAHLNDDLYQNKIAFIVALNFPYYTLEEKEKLGPDWSVKEWAYARLGDYFLARVPARLTQAYAEANTNADIYISQYNIYMGSLLTDQGEKLFPDDMILLSHWNLRDELKADYAEGKKGFEKQQMIYEVMKRIIDQSIPEVMINSGKYQWKPYENKVLENGKEIAFTPEPDTRYQQIINNFHALQAMDKYYPDMNTFIKRNFSGDMEISQPEVEALFDQFLTSPEVKQVAELIKKRLGRDLEPYDIWYDGFKSRSSISSELLDSKTESLYPNPKAFEADMPRMLEKLGWTKERAEFIASKISVDPARGSGHALGAEMHSMNSHLRTRIPATGMNYKGYNIAVHEFGHNVEQTISLYEVPYYSLHGVPSTAFTEALAFIFQSRDLYLLGMNDPNPDKEYLKTLDTFWSIYEIMGVSMVDMGVWKWLYEHPEANATQLKEAAIQIAKEVWNKYFAGVFNKTDEPILAIYSHMVSYPLYLSAYSYGHLIDFQIEQYLQGKNFASEIERIYSQGRLTPQYWMEKAVGAPISNQPVLKATDEALNHFNL